MGSEMCIRDSLWVALCVVCVRAHGRTCVDGGCARRQEVSDWSHLWRGVGWNSAEHMPRPHALRRVVVVMVEVVNRRAAGREREMWVTLTGQWWCARLWIRRVCLWVALCVVCVSTRMGVRVSMAAVHGDRM